MQFLNAEAVHRALPYPALIAALGRAHEGELPLSDCVVQDDPAGSGNQFVTLPGWLAGALIAVKMVGVFPGNRDLTPPQASVQGLVAGFDAATGTPVIVADGEAMTFRKTAAISGLGAALLARKDARELLVVGAGGLAPHSVMAHRAARPSLTRIRIWNRTPAHAQALADRLCAEGIDAHAVPDLDAAVQTADIISCVTMSKAPLVKGDLLKPGAHLDLVGAYLPDMREADDRAMTRGRLFVDTHIGREDAGDLIQPVTAGALSWDAIRGDLFDLVQGRAPGRENPDEITVFKNVGGAHQDVFTLNALIDRAAT